jgi:hypothetical protein
VSVLSDMIIGYRRVVPDIEAGGVEAEPASRETGLSNQGPHRKSKRYTQTTSEYPR